jgi:glycosyltransferase involved in cell wall biosynthesis
MIGHKLSSGYKLPLLRIAAQRKAFDHVICVCRAQADFAVDQLGVPAHAVDFVHDKVDHHFFRPLREQELDFVLVVGQEQRDYTTLLHALSGTGIKVVAVASSPWSTSSLDKSRLAEATVVSHIPYRELRNLYSQARLVVVPLFDVDYAAGVNTALEAMAMGKPLVVSRSQGITDYLVHGETGLYVAPGDAAELRGAVLSLWEHPQERLRLGSNARQAVEEGMNLDCYVERVAHIVRQAATGSVRSNRFSGSVSF